MSYFNFDNTKPFDVIPLGRVAIDFNPTDMNKPLSESSNFNKYVGGSPANIAVGLARLGAKCGFFARVSDDQFGDYVTNYFKNDGIDVSHIVRCKNGENLGLTFTEIKSPTESSILMYRDGVADLMLDVEDIDEDYIKQAKILVISGTSLCTSPSREAALKAMFLAKKHLDLSTSKIGQQIGRRDHATVLHACKTISNLLDTNKQFRSELNEIESALQTA